MTESEASLVVVRFADEKGATDAAATLSQLNAEGFCELDDVAVVRRAADGEPEVIHTERGTSGSAVTAGGLVGLVAGTLVGGPLLGAALGAGGGAVWGRRGADPDVMEAEDVGRALDPSTSAVVALVREVHDEDTVLDRLARHHGTVVRADAPDEIRRRLEAALGDEDHESTRPPESA